MEQVDSKQPAKNTERERAEQSAIIVEANLKMMDANFQKFLNDESVGGNAGSITIDGIRFVQGGANGYADPQTGRIVVFENYQFVNANTRDSCVDFTYAVAFAVPVGFFKITGIQTARGATPVVQAILKETMLRWNEKRKEKIDALLQRTLAPISSFDELYEFLRTVNFLIGLDKLFSADTLIERIENARQTNNGVETELALALITDTAGLRDKVRELLAK